jgi:hypothetical protein
MRHISAKQAIRAQPLTANMIHHVMRSLFPKKNDFGSCSYEELVTELRTYNIYTRGQFTALMKKHRRALIALDTARISPEEVEALSQICTAEEMADSIRRRFWYAYPGLVRVAAEWEFGEIARISADET